MPIQPPGAQGVCGKLLLKDEYAEGLKDLDGFSHIYIFYHFHKTTKTKLEVIPFMDKVPRGVFSTRTPMRPAHLGMSVVEVVSVEGNCVNIRGVDVLDGTPLIDIKPYILKFDYRSGATSGWMQGSSEDVSNRRSDDRFV
jgi:tRNA-Thr(GGU) m(6)t(6)A37 methyltransferase TsaA